MRVRTIVTAVSALGLLTVLTACSGGTPNAQVTVHPAAGSASATSITSTVHPPAPTATSEAQPMTTVVQTTANNPAAAPMDPASFTAEIDIQRQDVAMIMLTNTSKHTVTVQGWSALSLSNAHGDTLHVPTQLVEVPGPGPSIKVVPGGSVFAPIEWTEGSKADSSTYVADSVEVVPPGAKNTVSTKVIGMDGSAPGYYEFDLKSIKIGTFQPTTHNLLEF